MKKLLLSLIVTIVATVAVCAANLGDPVCFKALENNSDISLWSYRSPATAEFEYSVNGGAWQAYSLGTYITLAENNTVSFRNKSDRATSLNKSSGYYYFYSRSGSLNVSGDATTLINNKGNVGVIEDYGLSYLFYENERIIDASDLLLPSENVGQYAYYCMFYYCTKLQKTPRSLPAKTLAYGCYKYMFYKCFSLQTAPQELPAERLSGECYCYMFKYCSVLQSAPSIKATSLAYSSCWSMFEFCSKLNYVEVSFTDWETANKATYYWLNGVSQSGTFKCPIGLPTKRGADFIPDGWTVPLNIKPADPVIITAAQSGSNVKLEVGGGSPTPVSIAYSTDKGATWYGYQFGTVIQLQNVGDEVRFCNTSESPTGFSTGSNTYYRFASTAGKIKASGDATSLLCQQGKVDRLANYTFCGLFYKNTFIEDASGLRLPSTTLAEGCYYDMFDGCTNLTAAPELPATQLAAYCYQNMFYNCSKLSSIKVAFDKWRDDISATKNWVYNVSQSGTFICPKGLERKRGAWYIPAGWKVPTAVNTQNPVCITAVDAGSNVALKIGGGSPTANSFAYSTDGTTWFDYELGTVVTLANANDKVFFCNTSENPSSLGTGANSYYKFESTAGKIKASGDVTTLLCQQGKVGKLTDYTFCGLFYKNACLTDASKLELPSTILAEGCYYEMFQDCVNLESAPELPADKLVNYCYEYMFYGCSKLNSIKVGFSDWSTSTWGTKRWVYNVSKTGTFICPKGLKRERGDWYIPVGWKVPIDVKTQNPVCITAVDAGSNIALKIGGGSPTANSFAYSMDGTTWLDYELGTVVTLVNANDKVFFCNTSETPSSLGTGANSYYKFESTAGKINASGDVTTLLCQQGKVDKLTDYTFCGLFYYNNSLVDASKLILPSTNLAYACYYEMFQGCENLTAAPELPATQLAAYCYEHLFENCKKLNSLKVAFNAWEPKTATYYWLKNVSPTGTFICPNGLSKTRGTDFIPNGWMIPLDIKPEKPVCFTANADGSDVKITTKGSPNPVSLAYSTDGVNWFDYELETNITLAKAGDKVYFCNSSTALTGFSTGQFTYYYFVSSKGNLSVSGDVTSLLRMNGKVEQLSEYAFNKLFIENTHITDASQLELPSTILSKGCYYAMFDGCTSLSKIPELKPTATLAPYCYGYMFHKCNIVAAPELKSTTLAEGCYFNMFNGCTSLTQASDLPAEKAVKKCYESMFKDCALLAKAPAINAVVLAEDCFSEMFENCTSIEKAPVIKAKRLSSGACYQMFNGCSKLNYVEVNFDEWDEDNYATYEWLEGVAANGTYKCSDDLEDNIDAYGSSTFPESWIREAPVDINPENPVCFTSNVDGSDIMIAKKGSPAIVKLAYSYDGETWFRYRFDTPIPLAKAGDKVIFCNISKAGMKFSTSKTDYYKFVSTKGNLSVSGDVTSLLCESGNVENLPDYTFTNLFNGNKFISDAANLSLPSSTLGSHCYYAMFDGCTSLANTPELPSVTLAESCYEYMFKDCSSLTKAPNLPAEKAAKSCYANMFEGCAKLDKAPVLSAVMLEEGCFAEMFKGCTSLVTAPVINALSLANASCFRMFSGCEKLNRIEVLFKKWDHENYNTFEWLAGVSATGTFKCPDSLFNSIEKRDGSTFPEGWNRDVPTDVEEIEANGDEGGNKGTDNDSKIVKLVTPKGLYLVYPDGKVTTIDCKPTQILY